MPTELFRCWIECGQDGDADSQYRGSQDYSEGPGRGWYNRDRTATVRNRGRRPCVAEGPEAYEAGGGEQQTSRRVAQKDLLDLFVLSNAASEGPWVC